MRLIDADKLDWWYKGRPIRRVIDEAPTIDAVPVVRCKNCNYFGGHGACHAHAADEYGTPIFVREDDFCSYGERRGGE